jgi:hypothetical protein
MIALQMIQIRLLTSFPFFVSLCFVFLDRIENSSPLPPLLWPRKRNNFNLCSRSRKQEKGKSSYLVLLQITHPRTVLYKNRSFTSVNFPPNTEETVAVWAPAPRFKGPEHRLHSPLDLQVKWGVPIHFPTFDVFDSHLFNEPFSVFSYSTTESTIDHCGSRCKGWLGPPLTHTLLLLSAHHFIAWFTYDIGILSLVATAITPWL